MGGGANMNHMIKQAQKMQEQMMKMQEELRIKHMNRLPAAER